MGYDSTGKRIVCMNKLSIYIILLLGVFSCYSELGAENQNTLSKEQREALSRIQIPFIKNEGQIKSEEVKFYIQTINGTVFITDKGELIYTIINPKDYLGTEDYLLPDGSFSGRHVLSLRETPLADKTPQIDALENSPTAINYFLGDDPKNWRSNIQSYNLITLGEVWNGITLNLKANSKNIEKLFIITPDGTPESIRFSIEGIEELSLSQTGELELKTGKKSIGFTHPIAYQEINGEKKSVEVSFRLIDETTYGFTVGNYDKTIPLVIDPLLSSTFIGGFGTDYARGVVVDPTNGNVFVAGYSAGIFVYVPGVGWVERNNFPVAPIPPDVPLPYGSTLFGSNDVVVCKLNPTLTTLIASTFLGGTSSDGAFGIALDSQGNVFVCGFAQPGFPTTTDRQPIQLPSGTWFTPSAFDTSYNGPSFIPGGPANLNDAFVAKLSNSLNALLASTYLGGTVAGSLTADSATGIVIDESDNVFICGFTDSDTFQTNVSINYPGGASSINYNGGNDAFVAKFNNNLSGPTGRQGEFYFAGLFLGGSGNDIANAICLDNQNGVYITGFTTIGSPPFPVLGDGLIDTYDRNIDANGVSDAFISRFSNDLRTFRSSTYLGRVGSEIGYGITLGAPIAGEPTVYVTGITGSPLFPVTSFSDPSQSWNPYGATQPGLGVQDVFVSRLSSNLTTLINSTWVGGVDTETSYSICTGGNNNNIYICGTTESSDFPTTPDAFAITNTGGVGDVFVCSFNETLSLLNASTMVGGQYLDTAYCIKPDNAGNMIFVGLAGDNNYPTWPTTGTSIAYDISYNGSGDIFVTRISADLSGGFSQQPIPTPPGDGTYNEGDGIVVGSSSLAYLDPNAFRQSCFIATAVYGNPMHPNVVALRNFRDRYLLTNKLGSRFVNWYYRVSPPVAKHLKDTPLEASAVRLALTPVVYTIKYPVLILLIGVVLLAAGYWLLKRLYVKRPL